MPKAKINHSQINIQIPTELIKDIKDISRLEYRSSYKDQIIAFLNKSVQQYKGANNDK